MSERQQLVKELSETARRLRVLVLQAVARAQSGHLGGSFSAAELVSVLYFHQLRIDPARPDWPERDRFVLSKGHAAPLLYAALALRGYFPVEELDTLRSLGSRLQGHPDMNKTPGVDMTSGSLGQGLSVGLGLALGNRLVTPPVTVYVLLGDGELQEGQVWEAAMAAAHYRVSGLVALVDYNRVQLDGSVPDIMEVEPLVAKWQAFGWEVLELDGHDVGQVLEGLKEASARCRSGPVVVVAHTVKGKGVSFMEHQSAWHGKAPDAQELRQALTELERC